MAASVLPAIIFAEQMAALAASTITQIRAVIDGSSTQTTDQILTDADSTYQSILTNAKSK